MRLLTYKAGDCGLGYSQSILLINIVILVSFVPTMVLLISWIAQPGLTSFVFYPMLSANYWFIPSWLFGLLTFVSGLLATGANTDTRRNTLLNVWVGVIIIYTIASLIAGAYFIHFLTSDNDALDACLKEAVSHGGSKIRKALGLKPMDPHSGYSKVLNRAEVFGKAAVNRIIYEVLPYPLSAFYFLHWQLGVSIMSFLVVPMLMSGWAIYQSLGTRNFFASNPPAWKNNKISDGPLWDENDDGDYHDSQDDDDVSFDSSSESPHNHHSERPLAPQKNRKSEHTYPQASYQQSAPMKNPRDIVRVNPGTGKVVAGRNVVV